MDNNLSKPLKPLPIAAKQDIFIKSKIRKIWFRLLFTMTGFTFMLDQSYMKYATYLFKNFTFPLITAYVTPSSEQFD